MPAYIAAIDQGTTSTRFMLIDRDGRPLVERRQEHRQIMPRPGWVEHDPQEIWTNTRSLIEAGMRAADVPATQVAAIGITNQRETTLVWNRHTGIPYGNAIVWQDTRAQPVVDDLIRRGYADLIRQRTGLPPAAYFAGAKLAWILRTMPEVRADAERGEALCGTVDSWLLWNLTGGVDGGVHATDVTNASRFMLMDMRTLSWDEQLADLFDIPPAMLPPIRASADPEPHGHVVTPGALSGTPVTGMLGDQQAALVGQACLTPGDAKCTYGTGNFILLNTGTQPVHTTHGLVSTVAYQLAGEKPVYALEGSVAVTGAAVQWLRDQLGIIDSAAEVESLAARVPDNGGLYFVPAFSGLFAPYWRSDARGVMVGMTQFNTAGHLARATLEAICYQTRAVFDAMQADAGIRIGMLKVDGGITTNALCMQLQADILGVPVSRSSVAEATALGAAYAAGLATGFWTGTAELVANWKSSARWDAQWSHERRRDGYAGWDKAVSKAVDWAE